MVTLELISAYFFFVTHPCGAMEQEKKSNVYAATEMPSVAVSLYCDLKPRLYISMKMLLSVDFTLSLCGVESDFYLIMQKRSNLNLVLNAGRETER